jgi:hypothetical protein
MMQQLHSDADVERATIAALRRRERRARTVYNRIVAAWGEVRDAEFRKIIARRRRTWARAWRAWREALRDATRGQ